METLEPTPPARKSSSRALLAVVAGVVVIALIGLGALLIPRLLNTAASETNITAAALPPGTQVYFSVRPHLDQLPNGGVVDKAWGGPEIAGKLEEQIREALSDAELDWDRDIASWLGDEVGIGAWDVALDASASETAVQPSLVLAAATRDAAQSDAFLAKLRAKAESSGETFTTQTYRDVTITAADSRDQPAYATVEGFVLTGSSADALRAAIDALLDDSGFDKSPNYQAAIGRLRGGRAVTAYVDVGGLYGPLLKEMPSSGLPLGIRLSEIEALRLGTGISFEPNGVLMEFITLGDPDVPLPVEAKTGSPAVPNPNRLLRAVPDSALVYMSGRRLADWYDDILTTLKSIPMPGDFEQSLREFETQAGIDLKEDIFGWMTGEAAFVVMPGSGLLGAGPSPFGFAMVIEAGDKQLAESGPHTLFQALAAESDLEIVDVDVAGSAMHGIVDSFSGEPMVIYGLLGDNFVLAFTESAARKIANASERPLADDEDFQAAIAPLPKNTIGYVYFKPGPIVSMASSLMAFGSQECPGCDLFDPISTLAFTIEYPPVEAGVIRSALFVRLDIDK